MGRAHPWAWTEHEGGDPQGSDLTWRGEREKTQWEGTYSKPLKESYSPSPASLGLIHACASSQWELGGLHHEQNWRAGS